MRQYRRSKINTELLKDTLTYLCETGRNILYAMLYRSTSLFVLSSDHH